MGTKYKYSEYFSYIYDIRVNVIPQDLLKEFKAEATMSGQPRLLLTAAVAAGQSTVDAAYDVPAMAE